MGGGPVTLSAASLTPNDYFAVARRPAFPSARAAIPFHPIPVAISVYSQQQDLTAAPAHEITRRLSILLLKAGLARRTGQNAIQLTTETPWREIKKLARAHVDPRFLQLASVLPIREYPPQTTCMEEAFRRCMRYPVELAKEQRSWQYSWQRPA
jgi:hypothetical protein